MRRTAPANLARNRGTCRAKARCIWRCAGLNRPAESDGCIPRKRKCIVEGWCGAWSRRQPQRTAASRSWLCKKGAFHSYRERL